MSDLAKKRALIREEQEENQRWAAEALDVVKSALHEFENSDKKLMEWFSSTHGGNILEHGFSGMEQNSRSPLVGFEDLGLTKKQWMTAVKGTRLNGWHTHGAVHSGDSCYVQYGGLHSVMCLEMSLLAERNLQEILDKEGIAICASMRPGIKRHLSHGKALVFKDEVGDLDVVISSLEEWYKNDYSLVSKKKKEK